MMEFLENICKRPIMLGVRSSIGIECQVYRYYIALIIYNVPLQKDEAYFLEFNEFVQRHYHENRYIEWGKLIRFKCSSNEESISKFCELYNEFRSSNEGLTLKTSTHYIDFLASKLKGVKNFDDLMGRLVQYRYQYQIDSIIELNNILTGFRTSYFDRVKPVFVNGDETYENFMIKESDIKEALGKKYELPEFLLNTDLLAILSVQMSKSVDNFFELYKESSVLN
jgi:hypothetical protein